LLACNDKGVTFKWKDYRREGRERYKRMTLTTDEFIRRLLMHVLPAGFHRIRSYGLLASGNRADNVARARELLMPSIIPVDAIKPIGPVLLRCRAFDDHPSLYCDAIHERAGTCHAPREYPLRPHEIIPRRGFRLCASCCFLCFRSRAGVSAVKKA
jgi:hypothetical protein